MEPLFVFDKVIVWQFDHLCESYVNEDEECELCKLENLNEEKK